MKRVRILQEKVNGYWMKDNPMVVFLDESGSKYFFESRIIGSTAGFPLHYQVDVFIEQEDTALFFAIKYGMPD